MAGTPMDLPEGWTLVERLFFCLNSSGQLSPFENVQPMIQGAYPLVLRIASEVTPNTAFCVNTNKTHFCPLTELKRKKKYVTSRLNFIGAILCIRQCNKKARVTIAFDLKSKRRWSSSKPSKNSKNVKK